MNNRKKSLLIVCVAFFATGNGVFAQDDGNHSGIYQVTERCSDRGLYEAPGKFDLCFTYTLEVEEQPSFSFITMVARSDGSTIFPKGKTIPGDIQKGVFDIFNYLESNRILYGVGWFKEDSIFFHYLRYSSIRENYQCKCSGKWKEPVQIKNTAPVKVCEVFIDNHRHALVIEGLEEKGVELELYDILGKRVLAVEVDVSPIDVSGLSAGGFLYRLQKGGKVLQTGKIVKAW